MSNGSTFVRLHCWTNKVRQFFPSLTLDANRATNVATLLGTEASFLFQFSKVGKSLFVIDDLSHGNNKQSGYVQIRERALQLVESMVNKFRLIFVSIRAGNLAELWLHSLCKIVRKRFAFCFFVTELSTSK